MELLAIRMDEADLEELKRKAAEVRVPVSIYARSLIMQGMKGIAQDDIKTR